MLNRFFPLCGTWALTLLTACGSSPSEIDRTGGGDVGAAVVDAAVAVNDGGLASPADAGTDVPVPEVFPESGRVTGDPCDRDQQCASGTCLPPADGYPLGYCSRLNCRTDVDCERGAWCRQRTAAPSMCMRTCDDESVCRQDYECIEFGRKLACIPAVLTQAFSPVCESTALDFNAIGVAFRDGFRTLNRHEIEFDVPDDATSFLLVAWDRNGLVFPETMTAPDGRSVTMKEYGASLYIGSTFDYVAPVLVPLSAAYRDWVMGGTYKMTFAWTGISSQELCYAVIPEQAAPSAPQTLDIQFYLSGAAGLDDLTAPQDSEFNAMLDEVDNLFSQASIRLGDIQYRDLHPDTVEQYGFIRSPRAVQDLCELTVLPEGGADQQMRMNVVMIDAFIGDMSGVLGVSSGIVGGAGTHGSSSSCVVFASGNLTNLAEAQFVGKVMTHEIGHFLGLFHTTERDLIDSDPLADTVSCAGLRVSDYAQCPDVENLMFPFAYERSPSFITPEQGLVLRANPLTLAQ